MGYGATRAAQAGRRIVVLLGAAVVALVVYLALGSASARADAPPPLATQIASDPVSVSPVAFQRDLFVAGDVARLSDPANTENLVLERVLQALYTDNPGLDPTAAASAVTALENAAAMPAGATDLTEGANARIETVLVALQAAHPTGAIAPALATVSQDAVNEVAADSPSGGTNAESVVEEGESGDTLETDGSFAPRAVLSRSAELAASDHNFGLARDALWQSASGESIYSSADDLLASTASLATNPAVTAIAAMRDANGAINTTAGAIVGSASNPAANTVGAALVDLQTQEAGAFSEASAVATGQETQAAAQQQSSTLLAAMNQDRTAATIGVVTLSGKSNDATYASEAGTTAAAAGTIVMALANYGAKNITAGIATGNVVGAALSLVPTILNLTGLTSSGPDPDEIILQQLTALSNQIQSFQTEVNGRFDVVDQGLINVLDGVSNLSAQINQVAQQLNQAQLSIDAADSKITGVYDQVTQLQSSIDTLQTNIFQALSNKDYADLKNEIDTVIGYQKNTGGPLSQDGFNAAATEFHTFATFTAAHSPIVNGDTPSFDAQGVAAQLAPGVSANVDYLDQLPAQRGWRTGTLSGASSASPLPDPQAWALAARAYSQLLLENPEYVTPHYRGWLGDIEQEGAQLGTMVSSIGSGDTASGTHSTLFNDLLCNYTSIANASSASWCPTAAVSSASDVVSELTQAEQQYVGALTGYAGGAANLTYPLQQANGQPIALWGSGTATQTSDLSRLWTTLHPTVPECGPETSGTLYPSFTQAPQGLGAMQTPSSATPNDAAVPSWYQLADRLGLGALSECWTADTRWGVGFNFVFTPAAPITIPNSNFAPSPGPIYIGAVWNGIALGSATTPDQFRALYLAYGHTTQSCGGSGVYYTCTGGPSIAPDFASSHLWRMQIPNCTPVQYCVLSDYSLDPLIQNLDAGALDQLQAGLLTALLEGSQAAGNVNSGGVQQSLQRLEGAKGLLVDYASLGLSATLQSDDTLAGLIRGSSELWGSSDVVTAIQGALKSVQAGTPLTGDPVTTIVEPGLIDQGATELETALAADIAAPAAGKAVSYSASASTGSGAGAAGGNPFIDSVNDHLDLTSSSFAAGPAVTLSAPADGATLTSATFSGTAADGAADSPTVTVNVYPTSDTSGQPVGTASASESGGAWSVTVAGLANGTYTAQAQQSDTANPANVGRSSPVQFTLVAPASSVVVSLSPSSIVANGTSSATATATVTDANGHPISGQSVSFSSSDSGETIGSVTDHQDGTYTATVTSSTTPGTPTITATDSSVSPGVSGHATLTQTAPVTGSGQPSPAAGGTPSSAGQFGGGVPFNGGVPSNGGTSAPVAHATVGHPTVRGNALSVNVTCAGSAGASCAVRLVLSLTERLQGGQIKAITASAHSKGVTIKTLTLGSATATITAGHTQRVTVTLSAAGARLLAARHQLPATLVFSITSGHTVTVLSRQRTTFHATRPRPHRPGTAKE